jgi:phosphatidylserine synthase
VALLRQDARKRGADPASAGIVTLEVVGIAFVVGASFVQAVTDSLVYIGLAVVLGAAVAAWGLLTKVRRRVVAGGAVVLAAIVVLLAVPLVSLLPAWQGTALWIFLAGAGLVALLAATAIEKGRLVVHKALERYVALGDEWE